jgi:hypothetical protein
MRHLTIDIAMNVDDPCSRSPPGAAADATLNQAMQERIVVGSYRDLQRRFVYSSKTAPTRGVSPT